MIDEKKLIKDLMRTPHLGYYDEDIKTYIDCIPLYTITNIIENQPTVQPQGIDKDRLIEELEKIKFTAFLTLANSGNEALDKAWEYSSTYLDIAIETVKRGEQNETD